MGKQSQRPADVSCSQRCHTQEWRSKERESPWRHRRGFEVKNWESSAADQSQNKIRSFFFTLVLLPNLKDTAPWVHRPCREKHTGIHCFKAFCYLLMPENWKHKSDGLICDTVVCYWRGIFSLSAAQHVRAQQRTSSAALCWRETGADLSGAIKVRVGDETINDSVTCPVLLMTSLHSKLQRRDSSTELIPQPTCRPLN